MTAWTPDELSWIEAAEELEFASAGRDGTLRKPVTIWVVRVGDDLYVRSVDGRGSAWFRGVQDRQEGHISAGGVEKDVALVEPDDDVGDEIDESHRTKYQGYDVAEYIEPMVAPQARAATLRLVPSSTGS